MTNRRKVFPVLAALLVLLAGCGQLSTSIEQDDAFAPTEVATQALSWSIDTLDVDGWIHGPTAMAVGSDGTRHIAFVDADDGVMKYVSDQSGSWSNPETVGSTNTMAVSMAIDSNEVPHISFVDRDSALAYATRADGSGQLLAETVSTYATQVSLALDDSGTPRFAYVDSKGLQYALRTNGVWSASTLLANPVNANITSGALALDSEGHPHVAVMWTEYSSVTGHFTVRLGYAEATYDAVGQVSWQPLTVIAVYEKSTTQGSVALALDGSDHPHVAYRWGSGTLMYVRRGGSDWDTPETVHAGDSFFPSIALDSSGNPHVAFLVQPVQYGSHTVNYGMRSDTGWSTDVVETEGNAGPASLALDASGQPHISYSHDDGNTGTLKIATVASAPSDTSPPVITPVVVPASPDGANGWYASTVTVSWSVVDVDSEVTVTAGCEPVTIAVDTLGTTLTCSATSAGGTSTESVTIKRDATNPVVSVTGVEAGVTYTPWDVPEAGCMTSDAISGVEVFATISLAGGPSGAITASCLGASDYAGNEGSASVTYYVMDAYAGVEVLIDEIEQLRDEGVLKRGQVKGLITPLENALRSLKKGYTLDACNQLGDFIVEVEAKVPPLTVAQADDLIGSAEALREMLGCP